MCELTKEQLEQDSKPLDPISGAFNAMFGVDRADALSRKIAEAARICREVEDDEGEQS